MSAENAAASVRSENAQSSPKPFIILAWKPYEKNTLRGFVSIELPSGIQLHECTYHEKGDSAWIGLPGKPYKKTDGTTSYTPIVEIPDKEIARRFQQAAVAALRDYLNA